MRRELERGSSAGKSVARCRKTMTRKGRKHAVSYASRWAMSVSRITILCARFINRKSTQQSVFAHTGLFVSGFSATISTSMPVGRRIVGVRESFRLSAFLEAWHAEGKSEDVPEAR